MRPRYTASMIARLTLCLLLLQAVAAIAIAGMIRHFWPDPAPVPAPLLTVLALTALALAGGLLSVVLLRLAICLNNFFLAWRYRDGLIPENVLDRRGRLRLLRNEFLAAMLSSSWRMAFQRFGHRPGIGATTLPVLLIHGYGCNSGYWHPMSEALGRAGIGHEAIDLEPVFGDIDDYAQQVQDAVERRCRESGVAQLIIVAHSMGGLVTRAWLRRFGAHRLAAAITLGTPHQGTVLAGFGPGRNARQMQRRARSSNDASHASAMEEPGDAGHTGAIRNSSGVQHACAAGGKNSASGECTVRATCGSASPWLAALAAAESPQVRKRFISIRSWHDNIVAPQSAAILEGAENIVVFGVGHVALASDAGVQQLVVEKILDISARSGSSMRSTGATENFPSH